MTISSGMNKVSVILMTSSFLLPVWQPFLTRFICVVWVTDGTGCHHHGEPAGDVQTVQRRLCSVEDEQD